MKYDSRKDTMEHKEKVRLLIEDLVSALSNRGVIHDESKLESPEKETFDRVTPLLKSLTYGSDEYKQVLKSMGEALSHHYKSNRHHPEFWDRRGIAGMNLVDLVEMFCDWCAATERHNDGSIGRSISQQEKRFSTGPILAAIFLNTAKDYQMGKKWEQADEDYIANQPAEGRGGEE